MREKKRNTRCEGGEEKKHKGKVKKKHKGNTQGKKKKEKRMKKKKGFKGVPPETAPNIDFLKTKMFNEIVTKLRPKTNQILSPREKEKKKKKKKKGKQEKTKDNK